jgi:short-subunit dehydrogenase
MNVIITGASRGIGFQTALLFSKEYNVIAISRNKDNLDKLNQESNNNIITIPFDLENGDYNYLNSEISKHFDKIDILVNNAGLLINKPFTLLSKSDMNSIFNVNFFGVALLIQNLLPKMNTNSHIVNIGSMGGFQGSSKFPGLSIYSASKAALANLSECLAEELKEQKISVNCLSIGAVQTEMLESAFPGYQAPLKAEEMASYIVDFSKNGHKFFNGKILPVSLSTP